MNDTSEQTPESSKTPDQPAQTLDRAIEKAQDYHFSVQDPEGFWVMELESNPTITTEYIFFLHFMGLADPSRIEKCANYLLRYQQRDGGWNIFYGAPGDISTTVEAYLALKMAGISADRLEMIKARAFILQNGGVRSVRVFTKIFLAMLGQSSWDDVPAMPVELIFLPTSFYFNIYEMSSWSRGTIVPLSMVCAHKPVYSLDEEHGAQELFTEKDRNLSIKSKEPGVNWPNAFLVVDKFLKLCGKIPWKPFRRSAFKRAEKWVLKHQEPDGDFSGIQPAMLNSLLALHYQGYSNDHPAIVKGLEAVDRFLIETENDTCMQACVSPLWDTAIACNAMMDSGIPGDHPAIVAAVEWMLKKQITSYGDWKIKNPNTPPGGWAFEFYNENYPDTDDTAEILMAIQRTEIEDKEWKEKESQIAMTWLMSMQSANGGWGAFDQDNDHELFNKIPFADHGAMLDPPTADVTSRILWMLGRRNFSKTNPQAQKALQFVKSEQEDDGCWFGRWGVNYVYGTFLALTGLESMGEDMGQPSIRKAVEWLEQHQNEDGGWGETCQSYTDPSLRGQGKSTASQTAWAVIGLVSAGEAGGSSAKRGIEFLIREQKEDGSWWEDEFTGTGFPGHFYIKYHMYQHYFPLMALGRFKNATDKSS